MASSETLQADRRDRVGSRFARRLRAAGRIPCSLQAEGQHPHLDLSIDEAAFLASRRHHVHLYDLDVGGSTEAAVVRELQWDTFGERLLHIEFKRVQRGVATESEVELAFVGRPKGGVLNHLVGHVTISCIPSLIPDSLEINLATYDEGDAIHASDLPLPEGVQLVTDPKTLIASLVGTRAEPEEGEEEAAEEREEEPETPSEEPSDED